MADEEEYEIIPSGIIPGQVAKVLTILALPEGRSFTDPEHERLVTTINYSSTEESTTESHVLAVEKRPRGLRRCLSENMIVCLSLWILYIILTMAYSTINPFFPQVAEKKGVSPFVIGVIISGSPFCVFVLSPFIGYFLPYFAVWLQVLVGMLLVGCSYITLAFTNAIASKWVFIVSCVLLRVVEGVGTAILNTIIFSTFPKLYPKAVGTLVGLFELAGGFGYSLGPSLGGVMYQYKGFRFPFLLLGGTIIGCILPCTLLLRKMRMDFDRKTLPFNIILKLFTNGMFLVLVLVLALGYYLSSYLAPSLPVYLENCFNQTSLQIGLLYCATALTYLFAAIPVGPLVDKVGNNSFMVAVGMLTTAVSFLMLGLLNYTECRSIWVIRITYCISSIGCAVYLIPVYPELLKIGQKYLRPSDSKAALSSFVSGVITSAANLNFVIGSMVGGALETVLPVSVCSVVLGEVMGAMAMLLMGMSFIDKCKPM